MLVPILPSSSISAFLRICHLGKPEMEKFIWFNDKHLSFYVYALNEYFQCVLALISYKLTFNAIEFGIR